MHNTYLYIIVQSYTAMCPFDVSTAWRLMSIYRRGLNALYRPCKRGGAQRKSEMVRQSELPS